MKIVESLNNFLTSNRKSIIYIMGFLFIFILFFDISFASNTTVATPQSEPSTKNTLFEVINGFLKIVSALLGLLTFLVGLFLYPEWTSGSIVGLGGNSGALKEMWTMIANVVYFIFALIFIWIAFMNVIGKEGDYQLKEALPRFIIGVLIVPFTWFFVQFILSISSILTVGILSLPYDTFKDTSMSKESLNGIEFCKEYVIKTGKLKKDEFPVQCKDKSTTIKLEDILSGKNSESLFGITTVYTYGVMAVDSNGRLFAKDLVGGINSLVDLGVKGLFDLVFVLVYCLLMIALALALFVRGVYLWFYAMLSPLFGLLYFFKKEKEGMADGKFSIKEFISLALVPVYVSAALAFGLLFLFTAGKSMSESSNNSQIITEDGKSINFAGFTYILEGSLNDGGVKEETKKLINGFQGTFGTLLLQVFGLAILWIAVMAALKQSSITQNVIAPFDEFGKSIGQLAMKAPTYAPILPGGMSANSLAQVGNMPKQAMDNKASAAASTWKDPISNIFGGKIVDPSVIGKMNRLMDDGNGITSQELPELLRMHNDLVKEFGRNNPVVTQMEKKIAKIAGENKGGLNPSSQLGGANLEGLKNGNDKDIGKLFAGNGNGVPTDAAVQAYLNSKLPGQYSGASSQTQKDGETITNDKARTDIIMKAKGGRTVTINPSDDTHLILEVDDNNKPKITYLNKDTNGTSNSSSYNLNVENIGSKSFDQLPDSEKQKIKGIYTQLTGTDDEKSQKISEVLWGNKNYKNEIKAFMLK